MEGKNILDISITCFTNEAYLWNNEIFGNVFQRKRNVLARLGVSKGSLPKDDLSF